jgi:hypothetical protein
MYEKPSCNQGAHGRHHGDSAVLQFLRSAALESSHITIGGETCRVPEPNWCLHTKFVLKGGERNLCHVVCFKELELKREKTALSFSRVRAFVTFSATLNPAN